MADYLWSTNREKDFHECVKLLSDVADIGNSYAYVSLGNIYSTDNLSITDYKKSSVYYQKTRNAFAYYMLGIMHEEGKSGQRNITKAKELFKKACDMGLRIACDKL